MVGRKTIAELLAADPARRRVALLANELSDEDFALIMQAKVPAAHDYEYEDDPAAPGDGP